MKRISFLTTIGILLAIAVQAQPELVTGPVFGAVSPTTANVLFLVKGADSVQLKVGDWMYSQSLQGRKSWDGTVPVTFQVGQIPQDGAVQGQLSLNGNPVGAPFSIRGANVAFKQEWSFLMGSCALYGVGATGLIRPGNFTEIFGAMRRYPAEFMLWLGDNVYLLNGEWNSDERMYRKYIKVRTHGPTDSLLRAQPNYAVADDHDFGPDNSDGTFENKDATVACFKEFWPNPYYGTDSVKGLFSEFTYQDAHFFILDDRYEKIEDNFTQILGPDQMAWLKEKLLSSKATFKFIALGSQVVSEANEHETWADYEERQELLDYIRDNRIPGVIFFSGDRHFTELCVLKQEGLYPIYDYTSSPLTSILRKQVNNKNDPEFDHPQRVAGTKVVEHNFGRVVIKGPVGQRTCVLEAYDNVGALLWQREIPQSELQF
ncbi:MAG: alkaline phosphatase D family protein [Bacteroidia bacterium]